MIVTLFFVIPLNLRSGGGKVGEWREQMRGEEEIQRDIKTEPEKGRERA